jgi:hypothetical protein
MLLSESEAFWMAILHEKLTYTWPLQGSSQLPERLAESRPLKQDRSGYESAVVATDRDEGGSRELTRSRQPVDVPADSSAQLQAVGERIYAELMEHATNHGIARKAECKLDVSTITGKPPSDTVWALLNGHVPSQEELDELRHEFPNHIAEARQRLSLEVSSAACRESFETGLHIVLALVVCGYSESTPDRLYGFSDSGEPCVTRRIMPRDRGLYASLLQLLRASLPLPVVERLAMAAAGSAGDDALRTWRPCLNDLDKYIGTFVPTVARSIFDEFQSSNESREGWLLGKRMSQLVKSVADFCDGVDAAQADIHRHYDEDIDIDQVTSDNDRFLDVELDSDTDESSQDETVSEEEPSDITEGDDYDTDDASSKPAQDVILTPSSVLVSLLEHWRARAVVEGENSFAPDMPYDEEIREYAADHQDEMLTDFLAEAEDVAMLCRKSELLGVAEMIKAAVDVVPPISPMRYGTATDVLVAYGQLGKAFAKAHQLISDAMKVAYGELRLRELKWGTQGLPAPALTGWAGQKENIRDAIKVAIEQLNNGLKPFVVLTQLAPAVQSLLCDLTTQHVGNLRGATSRAMLSALKKKLEQTNDEELRVQVRIADALNAIRNQVAHERERSWDRDHAVFFLNGLSILLRQI